MRQRCLVRGAWCVIALMIAVACRPSDRPAALPSAATYDPAHDLGLLFADVQLSGIFPDSKEFVDARPKGSPAAIEARYDSARRTNGFVLRAFVDQQFALPAPAGDGYHSVASQGMVAHVQALWPVLTRSPDSTDPRSSLIPLSKPYIVPGGRFREIYYWDSYFTMLGLVQSGRTDLVKNMLDNFAQLIATVGHIPNGNRTYYLTRSQPPYFAAMVGLYARATDTARALDYLAALEQEHAFWMEGAETLTPGRAHRRVVKLANGVVLNRYWDDSVEPRPESYRPDVEIGQTVPDSLRANFYRNARATAESGWDFSSRW
ncbi:MAG TPA: trehalase family glycosidase, partial [Gemmatimonadales bacterium]|nr:trehalase family glycosidase [Gemmatimonadales bacterium]